jgi:nucleotide-binding universal stress UspA family protein
MNTVLEQPLTVERITAVRRRRRDTQGEASLRRGMGGMFTKILVCSDGSDLALAAARIAAGLARSHHADLTMLYVCQAPAISEPFPGAPLLDIAVLNRYARDMYHAVVARTLPVIREAGVACDVLEEIGSPVDVIARIAEEQGFDLIVMGCRGLAPEQAAQLGSVSYGVIHRVRCPVLIVR